MNWKNLTWKNMGWSILLFASLVGAQVTPTGARQTPSNLGGELFASNFGQWRVPKGNLGQYSWNAGSYCQPTVGAFSPGITINAFAVGTAVQIIDLDNPSMNETVTPTSVTITTQSCSINIAPAHGHNNFYFTSATGGLQEAINWAGSTVYVVILTPDWALLGGSTGTITSAAGNSSVSILDQRVSSAVTYAWSGSAYVSTGSANFPCGGSPNNITCLGIVAANASVTAVTPRFDITSPTYGCATTLTDNSPCIAAAAAAAAAYGNGVVYVPVSAGACFVNTSVVLWPNNASLEIDGCLQANASMAAVIQTSATVGFVRGQFFGQGIIDANGVASAGIDLQYVIGGLNPLNAAQFLSGYTIIKDLSIYNAVANGIRCGASGATGSSTSCYVQNVHIARPLNTAPVGSVGINFGNTTDSFIDGAMIEGYQTGVKIASGGDHDFVENVHPWVRTSSKMPQCFEDDGNFNTWVNNECDTPTVTSGTPVGLNATGNPALIANNTFYMGTTGGVDNVGIAIQTSGAVSTKITGNLFHGQSSSFRWAQDVSFGATSATATVLANFDQNVVIVQASQVSPALTLASLTTQAANTVDGNGTSGAASPTALAMPSCSSSTNALQWVSNTGFQCNSSISAHTSVDISAGTANQIPFQTGAGATSFISAAANSVLSTNGSNVPSESTTLPAGLTIPTPNVDSILQSPTHSLGSTCSMVTGTTCTILIGHTYSSPVCIATEQGTSATVISAECSVSGTTVTVTAVSVNSASFGAFVFGNPN